MESPINRSVINQRYSSTPSWTMPAEQYGRSKDVFPQPSGSGGAAPAAFVPPLWLTSPDTTHLKVQFGTVNGITPSGGWAGGGDDVGVSVDISGYSNGTYNIYMNATLPASGVPSAVQVDASTSAVPSDTSTAAYRLIGTAGISSGAVTTVSPAMAWSQEFVTCGRDSADPTTTPGTYFWELA